MADQRTTITELVTGLGTLGYPSLAEALAARPAEMVSLSPEQWCLLEELHRGGAFGAEFLGAWHNGVAFLAATDGLRGRRPLVVEWRGAQKQPGDEPVPADLRIDHVFLVSCKYLSKIVTNTAPATVFDRLLAGGHGHGGPAPDWFAEVAPEAYQALYEATLVHLASGPAGDAGEPAPRATPAALDGSLGPALLPPPGHRGVDAGRGRAAGATPGRAGAPGVDPGPAGDERRWRAEEVAAGLGLPARVVDLQADDRAKLQARLGRGRWPAELRPAAVAFSTAVAEASAARWRAALAGADVERVLWRLLRIGSAPYFVLGASAEGSLRLRIATAWDWRQHFRIEEVAVTPTAREQPVVQWSVTVTNRRTLQVSTVEGHVEIRWSHGKFAQRPEAKVYLDTPHHRVPGYWPLTPPAPTARQPGVAEAPAAI
ncbi:MAG TPA: hypothetical protein VIL36_00710 [Acidimicrobiales bacterium]